MYIDNIELINFRNYSKQEVNFINGINLFIGQNAQGKTNILESIYISAFGKSYRTIKDNEAVKFNESFYRINTNYYDNELNKLNNIEIYVDKDSKKQVKKNEVKLSKVSDLIGNILLVIFSPESLDIVKGTPQNKRKFLDTICCQISKSYYINLQEYLKCIKIKNNLLKKTLNKQDIEYIKVLNEKMSVYILNIVNFRKEIIEKLSVKSKIIHKDITCDKETINLEYATDFDNMSIVQITEYLNKYLNIEIYRKSSVKGIQKDIIKIYINNFDLDKYGSQGQNRTALLTLKLAHFEVLKEIMQKTPILLLDDIMSELDSSRIEYLLKYIKDYQSLITTTDSTSIEKLKVKNIKIFKVLSGKLEN